MLNIIKTNNEDGLCIALEGRLDSLSSPDLEKELEESLSDVKSLTYDLEKLEYISSAGLRLMLTSQKKMNTQGEMKLINVSEEIMDILDMTGFSDILTIE